MLNEAIKQLLHNRDSLQKAHDREPREEFAQTIAKINDAIAFLKNARIGGFGALVSQVRQWGVDKGLTGPNGKATIGGQLEKLNEEFDELMEANNAKDQHAMIDAVGDMTVVLILLSELAGFKFETCLRAAYDEIKARTGKMVNGQFVKDKP